MLQNPYESYRNDFLTYCRNNQIYGILLDLDDTILDIHPIFQSLMITYAGLLLMRISNPDITFAQVFLSLEKANNAAFLTKFVNPNRWETTIKTLADTLAIDPQVAFACLPILQEIYTTPPEVFPGAVETLDFLATTGIIMGLVTHANAAWTRRKLYEWTNLGDYFPGRIVVANEDGLKDSSHWRAGASRIGTPPDNILVVGDNVKGDILSSQKIGVHHHCLIPSKWSIYSVGDIPKETVILPGIDQMIPTLSRMVK